MDENGTKRASGFSPLIWAQWRGRCAMPPRRATRPAPPLPSGRFLDKPSITRSPVEGGCVAARMPEAAVAVVQAQLQSHEHLAKTLIVLGGHEAHPDQGGQQGQPDRQRHPPT